MLCKQTPHFKDILLVLLVLSVVAVHAQGGGGSDARKVVGGGGAGKPPANAKPEGDKSRASNSQKASGADDCIDVDDFNLSQHQCNQHAREKGQLRTFQNASKKKYVEDEVEVIFAAFSRK